MKSTREIQASKRFGEAWESFISGKPEKAYEIIKRRKGYKISKSLSDQLYWLQNYEYPELKKINKSTKFEFSLVTSWNILIDDYWKWALKENLAPFVGIDYIIDIDTNTLKQEVSLPKSSLIWSSKQEQYEHWYKLPNNKNISLSARSLFITAVKHAQVNLGGLVNSQYIGPIDASEVNSALQELVTCNLISINLSNRDLLMAETVAELKKLAFKNNLDVHGTKNQIVQTIVSELKEAKIQHWFRDRESLSIRFIRILANDISQLKKYTWNALGKFELYLQWLYERKYLGKSIKTIVKQKEQVLEAGKYKPLEPWRPLIRNQKRVRKILKSKRMDLVAEMWDAECDDFLRRTAEKYAWDLELHVINAINTQPISKKVIEVKNICKDDFKFIDFCYHRLDYLGIDVHNPSLQTCAGCGISFLGWSVDGYFAKRVGYKILFCKECYIKAFWGSKEPTTDKDKMLGYLSTVANVLGVVPASSFRSRNIDLSNLTIENQVLLVKSLRDMPQYEEYINKFGSWLQALISAGVLEDGTHRTARGVRCIANDGHVCNSLAEKTVDDWLDVHGINHEKEPEYPYHLYLNPTKMRADWKIRDIMVEYAGLMNDPSYAAKIKAKQELAKEFNLQIVILEPKDILNLDKKLKSFIV